MQTLFVGKNIIKLSEVDSTNNYASQLLRQSVINEGDIIVTENQKSGKGQRGNTWVSEPGKNLTFSLLLRPNFLKASQQFYLTKAISLAIVDVLATFVKIDAEVKWPNDIYVNKKKVAGILIENGLSGDKISHSIIGIGLNVNQSVFSGLSTATSVSLESGKKYSLDELLDNLCIAIEQNYIKLKRNFFCFDNDYLSKLLDYKKERKFSIKGKVEQGTIVGVNKNGQLEVLIGHGVVTFNMKEVAFID